MIKKNARGNSRKNTSDSKWDTPGSDPLYRAQDLMYTAWETENLEDAIALAYNATKISSDCADAFTFLGNHAAQTYGEALDFYKQAVSAAERALGPTTFKKYAGEFWGLFETRPYMRARAALAQCLWECEMREKAVEHYQALLRLNPRDNQGIRYLLMPCLIELRQYADAEELYLQYEEDGMAVWLYSRALLDFQEHGNSVVANKSLAAAVTHNEHVPKYLIGPKRKPHFPPEYYGFGDENEAKTYAFGNKDAWKSSPGALKWMRQRLA